MWKKTFYTRCSSDILSKSVEGPFKRKLGRFETLEHIMQSGWHVVIIVNNLSGKRIE